MSELKKILIIGPAWIGDMIMAQALFRLLVSEADQNQQPIQIDVLAPKWSQGILACMPEVNAVITMPVGHGSLQLLTRYRLAKSLRASGYDQAIVLANSFKSALIPFWAKIPVRTGWLGEQRYLILNDYRRLVKADYPLMVQRYLALGLPSDKPSDKQLATSNYLSSHARYWPKLKPNVELLQHTRQHFNLTINQPLLILCPGAAYGPAKRWPESHFVAVAQYFLAKQWQVGLLGGPAEVDIIKRINQKLSIPAMDLTATSLAEAVAVLASAQVAVSNDSGLMHMACAVDCPTIVLYGSSSPAFTPPLSQRAQLIVKDLPCQPCFKRSCPLGHLHCLTQITPDQVIQAIQSITVTV